MWCLTEGEPRKDSESEEDDLWYYYPDMVERQPRPESDVQNISVVEEDTVCHEGELDRSPAEFAGAAFTEEGHEELLVQSSE